MSKIKYLLAIIFCCSFFTSCDDYLDRSPDDRMTEEEIFSRYDYVDGLVSKLYTDAKSAMRPLVYFYHFGTAPACDEATGSSHEGAIPRQFFIGNWGPSTNMVGSVGQYWWDLYDKIRKANVILEGVEKYGTPDNPRDGRSGDLEKRIGETHFLRAYIYLQLIKQYGEAPYIDYVINATDDMEFYKMSFHDLVEKICEDAMEAYNRVPEIRPDNEFGRVDRGACLGLIAQARWFAATPLWNGGTLPEDTRVFKDDYKYDVNRWVKARDAAKAVIDYTTSSGKRYSLYTKYNEDDFTDSENQDGTEANNKMITRRLWTMCFDTDAIRNEWVWFVTRDKNSPWAGDNLPPNQNGHARQRPIQEQVDEYEIIIDGYGYPIYSDKAKGVYDDENPYINRDPRLYRDVAYHGSTMRGEVINLAEGNNALGDSYQSAASHSGYYLRKFIKEGWNTNSGYEIHGPAQFRLPHFIYIYAEAVNEINNGATDEIYNMVNEVRARSFMAPMPPEVKTNKALFFDYIQRERRVEFFYENTRLWYTRFYLESDDPVELAKEAAYKDANSWPYPKTQRNSHGMRPVEDPNGKIEVNGKKYKMERFSLDEGRVFLSPRHYLYPIMDDELRACPTLVQNPGW